MDRNQNENSPLAEKDPVDSQELFEPMTFYELIVPEPSDLPEAMAFYKQVSPQRYALIHSMNSEEENLTPVLNQTESETELLFRPLVQVSFQDTIEELPALSTPTAPAGKLPNAVLPKNGMQMDAASVVPEIRKSLPSMEAARRFIARIPVISVGEELYAYRHLRYEKLSRTDALRLITEVCREEVEAVGEPVYTQRIYDSLLQKPEIARRELHSDVRFVPFLNGLYHMEEGTLQRHIPVVVTTYVLQCAYVPSGATPHFDRFLWTITQGDSALTQRIWQMLGVIFCPDRAAKVFFVLQGPSDTGKSLFTRFVEEFFTADMVSRLNLHDLKQNFAPGDLEGKRLCISSDASSEALDPVATSLIKQATGGDVISADVKYKARIQFRCEAVFVLVTNHAVRTKDPDDAFFRRAVAIPFRYAVSRSEQISPEVLLKRLRQEMDVIASRAVETYRQLVQNRYLFAGDFLLNDPAVVQNPRSSAGTSVNQLVYQFVLEELKADPEGLLLTEDCYDAFRELAGGDGITQAVFSALFYSIVEEVYGGKKLRKRCPGTSNPRHAVSGVRFKYDTERNNRFSSLQSE